MRKSLRSFVLSALAITATFLLWPLPAQAGSLVFGPETFQRHKGRPQADQRTFTVNDPDGIFWMQVSNGEGGKNLVSSALIVLNGEQVLGPEDFNQRTLGLTRDIHLQGENKLLVEVRSLPNSFLTIEIRRADPNTTIFNNAGDLWGLNMGDFVGLWWEPTEQAAEYALSRSPSIGGPWEEIARIPLAKGVDSPPAENSEVCYQVEALGANGAVLRTHNPICIPTHGQDNAPARLAGESTAADSRGPLITLSSSSQVDTMCLSDTEFVNEDVMSLSDIEELLASKNSFLRGDIKDVDGALITPAQIIFQAAQASHISPQVLLATLQKEQGAVTASRRLLPGALELIMGYGSPSTIRDQIRDAAAQFRRDFDRLSSGKPTAGGWQVGVPKQSLDPLTVTPANKAVAILFSFTPWVGERWGGRTGIGGNSLFCKLWEDFGFGSSVVCAPGVCGTHPSCNPEFNRCFCFATDSAGTSGACVDDYFCSTAENCATTSCPAGKTCYYNTCCGFATCGPQTCTGVMR